MYITNKSGFTLIEMIVSLVILAFLLAVSTIGAVRIAQGFVFYTNSEAMLENAQLALLRLGKELESIKSITSSSATSITFITRHGGADVTYSVSLSGTQLMLNGDPLANNVTALAFSYYSTYNAAPGVTWPGSACGIISISITVSGPDNILATFTENSVPRNMGCNEIY